jgi:hypothetical protein
MTIVIDLLGSAPMTTVIECRSGRERTWSGQTRSKVDRLWSAAYVRRRKRGRPPAEVSIERGRHSPIPADASAAGYRSKTGSIVDSREAARGLKEENSQMSTLTVLPIATSFRVCDGVRVRFADTRAESDTTLLLLAPWPESLWAFRRIWHQVTGVGGWSRSICRALGIPMVVRS